MVRYVVLEFSVEMLLISSIEMTLRFGSANTTPEVSV